MARDIVALVGQMTLHEKASLTAGADGWHTAAIERLGIRAVAMTDGPNGARGTEMPGVGQTLPAVCVPCGAMLGATWDPDLVRRVGAMLGREAREKAARILLAPTVNLQRSPLFGRHFECYSEDPLLTGVLASAYIQGVQGEGVATTVKHFVGNESEFERFTADSQIDERTLRELYLLPFELAVRDGGTYLNGSRVQLDPAERLQESIIGTNLLWDMREGRFPSLPGLQELGRSVRAIRSLGAAALELAYVACGRYSGFAQYRLAPWDFGAGALLVLEAGGAVTQLDGSPLDITRSGSVVASNGRIHGQMLRYLQQGPSQP